MLWEQFIDSPVKQHLNHETNEKIFNLLNIDTPHLKKEQVYKQSVNSNELLRVIQAVLTATAPVLMCSEAEVDRYNSCVNDRTNAKAKEQSYFLGRQAMDSAIEMKSECDNSTDGLSNLGIVLSSIMTICLGSSVSLGVPRETLVMGLLEIIRELVNTELKDTNPLDKLVKTFSAEN